MVTMVVMKMMMMENQEGHRMAGWLSSNKPESVLSLHLAPFCTVVGLTGGAYNYDSAHLTDEKTEA